MYRSARVEAVLSSEIWGKGRVKVNVCTAREVDNRVVGIGGAWRTIISARVDSVCTHFSRAAEGRRTVRKEEGEGVPPLESWLHRGGCPGLFIRRLRQAVMGGERGRRRLGMIEAQEWWPVLYWLD